MNLLQPHTVTLKRPATARDASNNTATRDYANPTLETTVKCLFQRQRGNLRQLADGSAYTFDAQMFTKSTVPLMDDMISVALAQTTENFIIVDVTPQYDIGGAWSHNEISLTRETGRAT